MSLKRNLCEAAVIATLLFTGRGQAISRVGGGVASSESNFVANVPAQFSGGNVSRGKGDVNPDEVILKDATPQGLAIYASEMLLTEFASRYAIWVDQDPAKFSDYLSANGYSPMTLPNVACAEAWYKADAPSGNQGAYRMIFRFGPDQGVAIDGSYTNDVLSAFQVIQNSTKLTSGTCTWK